MAGAVALWAPDRAVRGARRNTLLPTREEDRRCDRCGVIADVIHPNPTALEHPVVSLVSLFDLCPDCQQREVAA